MQSSPSPRPTPVARITRFALILGCALALVAGIQLFLFSDRTADLFAWTIGVPLSAAFFGAGYWSTLPSLGLAVRTPEWQRVRVLIVGVLVFCVFIAAATLRNIGLFHLHDAHLVARGAAWIWLLVYLGLPWLLLTCFVVQERAGGRSEYDVAQPLIPWVRAYLLLYAATLSVLGIVLTVAPTSVAGFWPWPLTPLTAQTIGAWWLLLAACAWWAVREGDWLRVQISMPFHLAFFALQILTALRFPGSLAGDARSWVYILLLVVFLVLTAVATVKQQKRNRRPRAIRGRKQDRSASAPASEDAT